MSVFSSRLPAHAEAVRIAHRTARVYLPLVHEILQTFAANGQKAYTVKGEKTARFRKEVSKLEASMNWPKTISVFPCFKEATNTVYVTILVTVLYDHRGEKHSTRAELSGLRVTKLDMYRNVPEEEFVMPPEVLQDHEVPDAAEVMRLREKRTLLLSEIGRLDDSLRAFSNVY